MLKKTLLVFLASFTTFALALPFSSQHALVFEEESGTILLEKNAHAIVPIASLTKLMTAMVILDARQDMNELISIEEADVDTMKYSSSRVPVGAVLSRAAILELALMSSDNRAAAALARTYPGGRMAFLKAVKEKLIALGMHNSSIEEPTGLSPHNRSTATDLVRLATAASYYPEINRMTTEAEDLIDINGQLTHYRNTNRLVGKEGWNILLSKTGFTREAGRCLIMRIQTAEKHIIVVLLNAAQSAARLLDAENIQRYLNKQPMLAVKTIRKTRTKNRAEVVAKSKVNLKKSSKVEYRVGKNSVDVSG